MERASCCCGDDWAATIGAKEREIKATKDNWRILTQCDWWRTSGLDARENMCARSTHSQRRPVRMTPTRCHSEERSDEEPALVNVCANKRCTRADPSLRSA